MVRERKKYLDKQVLYNSTYIPWIIMISVTAIFMFILYPTLVPTKHVYHLGDVAESNIKAPKDFFIEDKAATESNRRQAIESVLTVYDHDVTLSSQLEEGIQRAFTMCREVFKPVDTDERVPPEGEKEAGSPKVTVEREPVEMQIEKLKDKFQESMGITISSGAYNILVENEFAMEIETPIIKILSEILDNGVAANKEILLRETGKGITLRDIGSGTEKLLRTFTQFYGLDQAKTMVRIIGQPLLEDMSYNLRNMIIDFVQQLIQPNITLNRSETEARKKKAALDIKPILYQIKAGEMLLREGERVTKTQLLKLDTLQKKTKEENRLINGFGAALIMLCLLVATYILYLNDSSPFQRNRNKNLLFIATVLIVFFFISRLSVPLATALTHDAPLSLSAKSLYFGIPLAAAVMTICVFMGTETALPFAIVIAAGTAVILKSRFDLFIYYLLNCAMAVYWTQHCRERIVFVKAGLKIGLLNMLLVTAIDIQNVEFSGIELLWDWTFALLGGLGAGIVTAGLAPLMELIFSYTTDIKLLELANLDRPILRRLMLEAPGTYHHSVIVGSMVEAAASEIGANPLLGKVCGYYHDIGKINKPLYFIENQTGGKNKHDKIAPTMSKRILIAHVKDGVEMAKQNRLGQILIDTIRQSHGTSLISFFYEKAKQQLGTEMVNADDFRYPGPKPQTREAGLVMLADIVEAASRTLENPTPSRIQGLVQTLINKVFSDGQLDECELTLKDLHLIAKTFNKILNGIHHHRIEYPEKSATANGKDRNGRSDRQQAKQHRDPAGNDSKNGESHLKRLGLS